LVGTSLNLKAYNSGQTFGFPGGEPASAGQFGSLLNNVDFNVLHINVAATTANPVTSLPATLANNSYWTANDATVSRSITITNGNPGGPAFNFDNQSFQLNYINKTVNLNTIEKWTVTNNNVFGHTFHIHDVQFKIVDRNGNANGVGNYESGWKDVMYVPKGESVSFVAKFDDYADAIHPFMYHCHFSNHEDDGMMGQFVVTSAAGLDKITNNGLDFAVYPNPANDRIFFSFANENPDVYYLKIKNLNGKTVLMMPKPIFETGIEVSRLESGVYFVELTDNATKTITVKKIILE